MRIFLLIWFGQMVSLLGSKLTEFALGVWVYQKTGSITQFAIIVLLIHLPNIIISPIAGALVDRWNRRGAMILSDFAAGISTLGILVLVFSERLEIWHIYLAVAISSIFNAFQLPAYTAAIAQLIPKKHYSRANGMVQTSKAIARVISPVIAGFLVGIIELEGILLIDFSTFVVAIITLLSVRLPHIKNAKTNKLKISQLLRETLSSWNYIAARPGLLRLLIFVSTTYFTVGILEVVFWPLVLDFGSSTELGIVLSIGGCGMLLGSLVISAWGGPKRRIYGILSFVPLQGGVMFLGGLQASVPLAATGLFGYLFAQPIILSCNQAIWQSKVPLNLQGRVFALQQMIERSLAILAYIIIGPLVDYIFEPLMATNGLLANSIGKVIGVGPGRGIALLVILMGIVNILATIVAYGEPRLRRLEKELPDRIKSNLSR
ncbi:MAG: MFS transporter [Xenococcaceae cyanobacterium]